MADFQFHGELFEERTKVQEVLAENNIQWLSDYSSIDLDHARYGIEVCGIREREVSVDVEQILRQLYPDWKDVRRFFWECKDTGWKVEIAKSPLEPYNILLSD